VVVVVGDDALRQQVVLQVLGFQFCVECWCASLFFAVSTRFARGGTTPTDH
jgi:hypothetical protein